MEIRNFNKWLGHRENNVDEGLFDFLKGRNGPAPGYSGPDEPNQVYTNPTVIKYAQEVAAHLGLGGHLEVIDNSGKKIGDYEGNSPEFWQAIQRFVAGHVLGGRHRTFINISYHDAAIILNQLDHLRYPGDHQSLAEKLELNNPQSLSQWMQSHVPMSPDAVAQQGFGAASQGYVLPRKKAGPGILKDVRIKKLVDSAIAIINSVESKSGVRNARINNTLVNQVKEMSDALEALGVAVPDSSAPTPTLPTPKGPPGFAGRGRKKP